MVLLNVFCWCFTSSELFSLELYSLLKTFSHSSCVSKYIFFNLKPKGESQIIFCYKRSESDLDPSFVPVAATDPQSSARKDVHDLSWKQLMDAYRVQSVEDVLRLVLQTLRKKIVASKNYEDTRDRLGKLEKIGQESRKICGRWKSLFGDYILGEEIGVYVCNACGRNVR